MVDLRKAAEMALQALCSANPIGHALEDYEYHNKATEALRQALAQPEQEPVGWFAKSWQGVYVELMPEAEDAIPFYTAPPKRPWVGLTEDESSDIYNAHHNTYGECITSAYELVLDFEAKLKEKNA